MNLSPILFFFGILGFLLNIILIFISITIRFLIWVSSLSFDDILGQTYAIYVIIMYLAIIVLLVLGTIVSGFFFIGRKVEVSAVQITRAFNSLEWILSSPPKPHAFVCLPLQSKVSRFTSTTLSKNVAENTRVNSKETLFKDKVLEDIHRLPNVEEIRKDVYLKEVSIETSENKILEDKILEDRILEDTHELRSGELLEIESKKKPFYYTEKQPTHYIDENSTSDMPAQYDFSVCDINANMESQVSHKMAHLTRILDELTESDSLLDEKQIISVMLEISEIWWFLFIFLMVILGLLTIIIYLLNKAKIKYLSMLSGKIKYLNLTKSLAFISLECKKIMISYKSLYSIKLVENLKNAIKIMNNAIDFYKAIKYITNKFDCLNKKSKKLVLTSNRMTLSDFLNFLDKTRSIEKRDLILKDIARYNSMITVYMYTMYGDGKFDMKFVENHIRFNFNKEDDTLFLLNVPRYMDYLAQTHLLLDLMFSYASIRNLAYAYQYVVDYSTNSRLNSDKVRLYNVHKLMWLTQQLGTIYPNYVSLFNLARLVEYVRLYDLSLDGGNDQLMDIKTRYEYLEEIISIMENIIKILCPRFVTVEFKIIGTVNTPQEEVKQYYYEHYRDHAG